MRKSIALRQQFCDSIRDEIDERTRIHQTRIAALRSSRSFLAAHAAPVPAGPLVMLAHGDSWFDYPLDGNSLSLADTDIIAQLGSMGTTNPVIHNISHYGDASTEEMAWPKQERLIQSLQDSDNWVDGKPDAILFSGGGNDIAGDQFCIFLDYAGSGSGLNGGRFTQALGMVEASYRDLFAFRDRYAPGVPIFGHCYDFPIPNGVHPICAGPWLQPSLSFSGWNLAQGTTILHQALVGFRTMLLGLASTPANNFFLVDTQGVLAASDWANELHPYPAGFKNLAAKFVNALRAHFNNRI